MKNITMCKYLLDYIKSNKDIKHIIQNYDLIDIPKNEFLSHFNLPDDKEKVMGFILNPSNCFEISKFGHRYNGKIVDETVFIDNTGVKKLRKKRGL